MWILAFGWVWNQKKEREEANGSGGGASKEAKHGFGVERRMSEGPKRHREVKAPQSTKASCNLGLLKTQHDVDGTETSFE